jgi:hypothetical protein
VCTGERKRRQRDDASSSADKQNDEIRVLRKWIPGRTARRLPHAEAAGKEPNVTLAEQGAGTSQVAHILELQTKVTHLQDRLLCAEETARREAASVAP